MLAARFMRAVLTEAKEMAARLDILRVRQNGIRTQLRAILDGTLPIPPEPRPEPPDTLPRPLKARMARDLKELRIRSLRLKAYESQCWRIVLQLRRLIDRASFIERCSY